MPWQGTGACVALSQLEDVTKDGCGRELDVAQMCYQERCAHVRHTGTNSYSAMTEAIGIAR